MHNSVLLGPNKYYNNYLCCATINLRVTLLSKALALALTRVMFSLTYMLDSASGPGTEDFTESLVANRETYQRGSFCSLYSLIF